LFSLQFLIMNKNIYLFSKKKKKKKLRNFVRNRLINSQPQFFFSLFNPKIKQKQEEKGGKRRRMGLERERNKKEKKCEGMVP
jgi:hypothetical protein